MYATRECPKCGQLFLKSKECPDCRVPTKEYETKEARVGFTK